MASITRHLAKPVIFTRGHLLLGALFAGLMLGSVVYVSHLNRESLNEEREARLEAEFRQINDRALTAKQVREIAHRQARLEAPTNRELARRSRQALVACSRSPRCREQFTRVVNRVLTIRDGRLVPVPPRRGDVGQPPAMEDTPQPDAGTAPPPPKVTPVKGDRGEKGEPGAAGKDIDSAALARIDTTLAALEQGLSALGSEVRQIVSGLCVPALRALLGALRVCS